jgi:uncharacterized membrane protein
MNNYLLLLIITLSWGLLPFFQKVVLKKLNSFEFYALQNVLSMIPISFYIIYYFYNKKAGIKNIYTLNQRDHFYLFLVVVAGIIGSTTLAQLLKQNNATYVVPNVQPLIIVFTSIVGYLYFKEHIETCHVLGVILIIMGLFTINYSKIKAM